VVESKPELISNGTFDANIDGWENVGSGVGTWVSGRLQVERVSSATHRVAAAFAVVEGKEYEITIGYAATVSGGGVPTWRIGTTQTMSDVVTTTTVSGSVTTTFTAIATGTHYLTLGKSSNGLAEFDDISIKEVVA